MVVSPGPPVRPKGGPLADSPNSANPFNNRVAGRYFVGGENEARSFENGLDVTVVGVLPCGRLGL